MPNASPELTWAFAALTVLVAALFPISVGWSRIRLGEPRGQALRAGLLAALGVAAWLTITGLAASTGRLAFGPMPPPLLILFVVMVVGVVSLSVSRVGRDLALGLPLAFLVGVQTFRLPLELLMHRAWEEGVMPAQMSYSGLNFDIVTGATAPIVAVLLARGVISLRVVGVWNWMGTLLLVNIIVISILSTPTFGAFDAEPPNVWVTQAPFVWLPGVMVMTAILGHLCIFRRLRAERAAA
jgi:hypothetical protein